MDMQKIGNITKAGIENFSAKLNIIKELRRSKLHLVDL